MVSKTIKKTPTKPSKPSPNNPRRRRGKSPLKKITSAPEFVVASIDKSLRTCQRRLIKIFAHLACLSGTPKRRKHGFHLLSTVPAEDTPVPVPRTLPPPSCPGKKTVFLDLDETLVHSKTDPPPENYDFIVHPTIDGQILTFYVLKRPGVDELLEKISKNFEIVVFTAGLKEYASMVLDRLDPVGDKFSHRLYRDTCTEMEGRFVKDLSGLGRDLSQVALMDDNPNAYVLQPENAVPVSPFIDNLEDGELHRVIKFFEAATRFEDMREAVKYFLSEGDVGIKSQF